MAGIFDNPDAAYAKLKEMGKGLFSGSNAGALGGFLNNLSGLTGNQSSNGTSGGSPNSDSLGGLGQTLGGLIQQGLSGRSRSLPSRGEEAAAPAQPVTPPPAAADNDTGTPPDSQPMNDVLKQLFSRSPN
jgi:AsmA protein